MTDPTATTTVASVEPQPAGLPDTIATAVHTYRMMARRVRRLMRHPNPLARGAAQFIFVRNRALTIIHAAAPAALADAIDQETALMLRLGYLRESGEDSTGARAALRSIAERRREILFHLKRGTLADEHMAPRAR